MRPAHRCRTRDELCSVRRSRYAGFWRAAAAGTSSCDKKPWPASAYPIKYCTVLVSGPPTCRWNARSAASTLESSSDCVHLRTSVGSGPGLLPLMAANHGVTSIRESRSSLACRTRNPVAASCGYSHRDHMPAPPCLSWAGRQPPFLRWQGDPERRPVKGRAPEAPRQLMSPATMFGGSSSRDGSR